MSWTTHLTPTNPIRLQGCLIVLYVLTTLGFCTVGYETFDDNFYWRDDRLVSTGILGSREWGLGGVSDEMNWGGGLIRLVGLGFGVE